MNRLLAIWVLTICTLGLSCSDNGADTDTAPGYRIAFNVLEDADADDYEVYVMELDGSRPRNVTHQPGVEWAYVADGDRLYAVSDRDAERRVYSIFEVREDGDGWNWHKRTKFPVIDSWIGVRNGGEELAVASEKDGQPDLYLIDREGNELRRLTDDPAHDRDPAFSPDGESIVWASSRSGIDELWILELATGEARQLTRYPEELLPREGYGYHAGPPAWPAALGRISFCSKRHGVNSIYSIRPDGTDLQRLTEGPHDRCWHAWSPDGRYLAYDGKDDDGHYDIYLRDMTTGTEVRLTEGPRTEQAPVFLKSTR